MKHMLREKLIELGYSLPHIEDKLKEWDGVLKEGKAWEGDKADIVFEMWDRPTEEIPKFFLNIDKLFEKVLLFDGDIRSMYKENTLNDSIQFADYNVDSKLCLLRVVKK